LVEPFAHGDVSDVWAGLTLAQRRAIVKVTATITLKPMNGSGLPRADAISKHGIDVDWIANRKRRTGRVGA
jgi:hypothetical protein